MIVYNQKLCVTLIQQRYRAYSVTTMARLSLFIWWELLIPQWEEKLKYLCGWLERLCSGCGKRSRQNPLLIHCYSLTTNARSHLSHTVSLQTVRVGSWFLTLTTTESISWNKMVIFFAMYIDRSGLQNPVDLCVNSRKNLFVHDSLSQVQRGFLRVTPTVTRFIRL